MGNTDFKIILSGRCKCTNQAIKILGVNLKLGNNKTNLYDLNIIPKLTKIDSLISIWKIQDMTPHGP